MVVLKLLINYIDRTSLMQEREWHVTEFDGSIIDSIELSLEDENSNVTITEGQELVLENALDATERFFAGIIVDVDEDSFGIGRIITITASDWKMITDRAYFTLQFDNKTDKDIIQAAFVEASITEIDTETLVQSAQILDKLVFRGSSLRQMLDTVSEITGWFWDIDKFKKLIYRPYGDAPTSFSFTDGTPNDVTTFPYYLFRYRREIGQFNEIEVHGSSKLSPVLNQIYSGDGRRKRFTLSQDGTTATGGTRDGPDYPVITRGAEGAEPDIPNVDLNTGSNSNPVWTVQTVGIEEQDTGKDLVWNAAAAQVLWEVAPPNFASNSWRISGRGFVRAGFSARDEAAILFAGRVFKKVLVIPEVEDDDQAIDVANAFLRTQGPKQFVLLTTNKDGIRIGDSIAVTNVSVGLIAVVFHVNELSMRGLGGTVYEYRLVMRNAP